MKEKTSYKRRDYEAVVDSPESKTILGENVSNVKSGR